MEEGLKAQPETRDEPVFAGLIEEIKAVEADKSPVHSLGLFIVTLIIFFTSGMVKDDIREIGILVGVLFFHEMGHLLAMKLLGYRDVRMFFIPFLGAAVTGKSRSDSAIRSCFVSLMGPLPGVVAGVLFLFLYKLTNNFYLLKTAQIMLILNVFNLLPIMPLDGGRYVDVMFIRNRHFRFVFALFGVACFTALAVSGTDIVLGIVAALSLVGALANLRINGVARRLLAEGMDEKDLDALAANPSRFDRVLSELRSAFPKAFSPQANAKTIHGHVTHILDSSRFVPAGWFAKVALGLGYGAVLLVSLLIAILFLASDFRERIKATDDGSLVLEKFAMRDKVAEIPLNRDLYYHGLVKAFAKDTTKVSAVFEYENGYRVGRRVDFGPTGDTTEIDWYTRGRFDSSLELRDGKRILTKAEDRGAWSRLLSWVILESQPHQSNHKHFD